VHIHHLDPESAIADYVRRFRLKSNWSHDSIKRGRRSLIERYERQGRLWTRDRARRELRRLWRLRVALYSRKVRLTHPNLHKNAVRLFKSWDLALADAGIKPHLVRKRKRWTKEAILETLRKERRLGHDLTYTGLKRRNQKLYYAARSEFGSFAQALRKTGVDPDAIARHRRWTPAEVLREIRSLKWKSVDRNAPSYRRLQRTAKARFGSWKGALSKLGLAKWAWRPLRGSN
jgi:hypothetical protein